MPRLQMPLACIMLIYYIKKKKENENKNFENKKLDKFK